MARHAAIRVQVIIVAMVSWLAGVAAYVGTLALAYGDPLTWGDISAMLFWASYNDRDA